MSELATTVRSESGPTKLLAMDADTQAAVQLEPRAAASLLDPDSREWLRCLRADGAAHDDAIARLHALLLRAARFEVAQAEPDAAASAWKRTRRHRVRGCR